MTELSVQDSKPAVEDEAGGAGQENGEKKTIEGPGELVDSVEDEDTEDLDNRAKALMTLLKTSKVSCRHRANFTFWSLTLI